MKKFTRWALCLGLALALSLCFALADEAPGIKVQLDGQDLAFTDAVPQVKDQRTFLPFRAVFEAMGAEVDYEDGVVTAVRNGKTLTMTLGQATATVADDGKTTTITMDVAPYADTTLQRTYVPVRFAAQAFGCSVGWDPNTSTAIIIDVEKLLDQALTGKNFTYLEKLGAMNAKYYEGIWDMTANFDADISVMTMPMTMTGTAKGTTQGKGKADMDMNMKLDMSTYMDMAAQMSGQSVPAEIKAQFDALKDHGVDISFRGNMTTGKLYMNLDMGALAQGANLDPDVWYLLDMAALVKLSGMDSAWAELLTQAKDINMLDLVKTLLSSYEPTSAVDDYADLKRGVDEFINFLSDEGFVNDGNQVTSIYEWPLGNISLDLVLSLDMEGETPKGYHMNFNISGNIQGQTMNMHMDMSMNDKDEMTAKVDMDMGGMMSMDMTMNGKYTPGTTAPVTTPPAGATVVDYMELLASQMGTNDPSLGIIGGADGPTTIVTTPLA